MGGVYSAVFEEDNCCCFGKVEGKCKLVGVNELCSGTGKVRKSRRNGG